MAKRFIGFSAMASRILWTIRIDPALKCKHVNLVTKSNVPGEAEYLFAPYSAFTVLSVSWTAGTIADPHRVELFAAPDNLGEPLDLPLVRSLLWHRHMHAPAARMHAHAALRRLHCCVRASCARGTRYVRACGLAAEFCACCHPVSAGPVVVSACAV